MKTEPENAEIQNYLGLTLGQKGLRGPAENATWRAPSSLAPSTVIPFQGATVNSRETRE